MGQGEGVRRGADAVGALDEAFVLGLDLGPNSVGWALVRADAVDEGVVAGPGSPILAAGVRVFEAGLENYGSSKEEARSQKRRAARSARRINDRRARRRRALRSILRAGGLLPADPAAVHTWLGPYSAGQAQPDPYALRSRGLDERLDPFELGVAIYHIAKRRGFRSNRKEGRKARDDGTVSSALLDLARRIEETDSSTLGRYLYRLRERHPGVMAAEQAAPQWAARLRNRYTARAMLRDEFDRLWDAQRQHHPALLTDALRARITETVFHQRPYEVSPERVQELPRGPDGRPKFANLLRSPTLAQCPLVPEARRLWRGHWLAQQFRLLKEVNNLRMHLHAGSTRALHPDERAAVLAHLMPRAKAKFEDLRACVADVGHVEHADDLQFNLELGGRKELDGNRVEQALVKAFRKARWAKLPEEQRRRLRVGLSDIHMDIEDPDDLHQQVRALVDGLLDDKGCEALASIAYTEGYLRYSRPAIERILPYLEQGLGEYEAVAAAFPERARPPRLPELPRIPSEITNPVVRRALGEARRVVNAIIRRYGTPVRIHVELARDAALTGEQRRERNSKMRQNERKREAAKARLLEAGIAAPTRDDILAFQLWEEQGHACPYTGQQIGFSTLIGSLRGSGELQVDHILPRWRSGDDSYMNKVLCWADANRKKGSRTPLEWLGAVGADREAFLERVRRMGSLPPPKRKRLLQAEIEEDAFTARQLNDTRYISRAIVAYLGWLYDPSEREGQKRVQTCTGLATSEFRQRWGLNGMLSPVEAGKDVRLSKREDHRHHAVDALVVALVTRKRLKNLIEVLRLEAEGRRPADRRESALAPPWPALRHDAFAVMDAINVSHRVDRKLRGPLHLETYYGRTREEGVYVTRYRIEDFTKARDLDAIRDEVVRRSIIEHLTRQGWTEGADIPSGMLDPVNPPRLLKGGMPIRRVRVSRRIGGAVPLGQAGQPPHRFAESKNNHHLLVWDERGTDDPRDWRAEVVPMHEAMRRVRREGVPAVRRDLPPPARFLYALMRKDSVLIRDPTTGQPRLCILQNFSGPPDMALDLRLRDVRDARPATLANKNPVARVQSIRGLAAIELRPVVVDLLGQIHPA